MRRSKIMVYFLYSILCLELEVTIIYRLQNDCYEFRVLQFQDRSGHHKERSSHHHGGGSTSGQQHRSEGGGGRRRTHESSSGGAGGQSRYHAFVHLCCESCLASGSYSVIVYCASSDFTTRDFIF